MARKGGWPEKNPETSAYPMLTTPLSTTAPAGDPQPGINNAVPNDPSPSNPVGYSNVTSGGKKKR